MACGVPVVAYRRGGPAELIEDGLTGYVVPPDQPEELLQHLPAALELDRLACRHQAESRFGLEAFGARLEAWINKSVATA